MSNVAARNFVVLMVTDPGVWLNVVVITAAVRSIRHARGVLRDRTAFEDIVGAETWPTVGDGAA